MIDAITSTVSAVDVAERLGLEPSRSGYIRCLWHTEDTPSLKLYPENRGWHCFGCGKSGDVIDLVQRVQGLSFRDAQQWISDEFGLGLQVGRPQGKYGRQRAEARRARERRQKERERQKQRDADHLYDIAVYMMNHPERVQDVTFADGSTLTAEESIYDAVAYVERYRHARGIDPD